MATIIQLRRGQAASWEAWESSPSGNRLARGEIGLLLNSAGSVIDRRTGDGVNRWANLARDPVYWDQLATPTGGDLTAAQVKVTDLVTNLPQAKVSGLVASLGLKAPLASPALTGTPTAPTAATENDSTQVATTAFVKAARVKSDWNAASGSTSEVLNKPDLSLKANLVSPTFTGTPAAPTAPTGTNDTQLATTAFVQAARIRPDWNATLGAINEILNKPSNATTSTAGFMSAADKTKLDSLNTGYLSVDWEANVGSYNAIANKPNLSLKADLFSPTFTGVPTAPTAATGVNTAQLATTAFVQAARIKPDWNATVGAISEIVNKPDITLKANLASPALTGVPTAPTASASTDTTQIATTAFVQAARIKPDWNSSSGTSSEILNKPDITLKANLASPAFTGTPTAPTASAGTDTTQLATTAFVKAARIKSDWNASSGADSEIVNKPDITLKANLASPDFTGYPTAPTAPIGTSNTRLATTEFVQLAVSPPLVSPAFTGTPTAPTAPTGTNNTQLATTAFVQAAVVSPSLVSPAFSGTPTAPTAPTGTNNTQLATTAFVQAAVSAPSLVSPAFSGIPTAPTASATTNSDQIATTAFVQAARIKPDWNVASTASAGILNKPDLNLKADIASPTLTGTPRSPTMASSTNGTQIATTAFVKTVLTEYLAVIDGGTSEV